MFGILISLLGLALLLLGLFGDSGLIYVGLGMAVVFLGVAVLGPIIAAPISGALGIPIQKIKGITGAIARENAMRNPKRTSATAAALMIGVALVGLITVFAASARTSVNAAIDRSMKADYVITSPGFGQGSIPLEAQQQLAALPNVQLASGIRSGQAKIEGSVEQVIAADPTKIDSLFDLAADAGPDLRPQRQRHRGARHHRQRQRLEGRRHRADRVRADGQAAVQGRVDLPAVGLHELRDHHRRLREELPRPVRLPGVREHQGWRHAREHRVDQAGHARSTPGPRCRPATSTRRRRRRRSTSS